MGEGVTRTELQDLLERAQLNLELAYLNLVVHAAQREKVNLKDAAGHAKIAAAVDELIDNWDEIHPPSATDTQTRRFLGEYDQWSAQIVCLQADLDDVIEQGHNDLLSQKLHGKTTTEITELLGKWTDSNLQLQTPRAYEPALELEVAQRKSA